MRAHQWAGIDPCMAQPLFHRAPGGVSESSNRLEERHNEDMAVGGGTFRWEGDMFKSLGSFFFFLCHKNTTSVKCWRYFTPLYSIFNQYFRYMNELCFISCSSQYLRGHSFKDVFLKVIMNPYTCKEVHIILDFWFTNRLHFAQRFPFYLTFSLQTRYETQIIQPKAISINNKDHVEY